MIKIIAVENGYKVEQQVYFVPSCVELTLNDLKTGKYINKEIALVTKETVYTNKEELLKYLEETLL